MIFAGAFMQRTPLSLPHSMHRQKTTQLNCGPNVSATVDFTDTVTGVITIDSCTSANGYICAFRPGATIAIRKVAGNDAGASTGQDEVFNLTPIGNLTAE